MVELGSFALVYEGLTANEAEKAADMRLLHSSVFRASGRVYLSGTSSDVRAAKNAAEVSMAALNARDH
jgi:hypothetical protein